MSKHWSNEDLINKLYGIGPDDAHLAECDACRTRWLQIQERRRELAREPEVSAAFLARQRGAIHRRLESGRTAPWSFRIAPALAAMAVVVLGVMLSRPAPAPEPTLAANDSDFFTEIYSMVEDPEPWAAQPIYGLFED